MNAKWCWRNKNKRKGVQIEDNRRLVVESIAIREAAIKNELTHVAEHTLVSFQRYVDHIDSQHDIHKDNTCPKKPKTQIVIFES